MTAKCSNCRWWSEDDDPGPDGTCTLRLNEEATFHGRWRTTPNYHCGKHRPVLREKA